VFWVCMGMVVHAVYWTFIEHRFFRNPLRQYRPLEVSHCMCLLVFARPDERKKKIGCVEWTPNRPRTFSMQSMKCFMFF
jgi:hypothetical protein